MTKDPRIQGYARALFEVATAEGALADVEDDLFRFARLLEQETRLREGLTDIGVPAERRAAMAAELLADKASPHTINLIRFVIESGRARELTAIVDSLVEMAAAERAKSVAEVRSAVPLDGELRSRLQKAVEQATGKTVEVKVIVDPSIVGGLHVRVGDVVFDGTIRRRLQLAKEHLERG